MSLSILEQTLERFFRRALEDAAGPAAGAGILVAFSGGPDSTALLAGLARVAPRLGAGLHAGHLDHAHDPDSARRARAACRLAAELSVPITSERLQPTPKGTLGPEATARRDRYAFLEKLADELGASFIATAHHADDQAETVLLRLLFGSGIEGLAGIRPRRGRLVRPLLTLRRRQLSESLHQLVAGGLSLRAVADPTNKDLRIPRNRIRHLLLPRIERDVPESVERLGCVAAAATAATDRIEALLAAHLEPGPVPHEPGVQVRREAFDALPRALLPHALALLHRRAGVPYPAGIEARRDLLRQLTANRGGRAGCDCGDGWRWEAASGWFQLVRRESSPPEFAYTLDAPGEVTIQELGLCFRLRRGRLASWMFKACPNRAGLEDFRPVAGCCRIEVRSRRPGDRLTPLGGGRRRLKDLLIDRRVPRRQRSRLPLLVVDGEIAWVPGITIGERFRLSPEESDEVWIAEIRANPLHREDNRNVSG